MRMLKVYDRENYTEDMPVFEKKAVRAVIIRDGKIATQKGIAGDYKILGGGVDAGETFEQALAREVREESGLLILPETIREIGEMLEVREDIYTRGVKYVGHSYFFFCDAKEEMVEPEMTDSEKEKGFHLVWADPRELIESNRRFVTQPWTLRDADFVEMLWQGKL